jgi:hypothetical protein
VFQLPARVVECIAETQRDQFQFRGQALELGARQSGKEVILAGVMSYGQGRCSGLCVLMPAGDFHADSAVAEEATSGVEHGLAADAKLLP